MFELQIMVFSVQSATWKSLALPRKKKLWQNIPAHCSVLTQEKLAKQ
jgi:hypothetical protein